MAVKLSALVQVYNEELCMGCCLAGLLPVVDECVIVNGGPQGPSTDSSLDVIKAAMLEHPGKIKYLEGTFRQEDGQWDHTGQNNLALDNVEGDFVIRAHADLIYSIEDVARAREAITRFPNKNYFYAPMIDFYCDTDHILLPSFMEPEKQLGRPQCGDPVAISMRSKPRYMNYEYEPGHFKSGMNISLDWVHDTVYLPHVSRYHFAFVKPFNYQVYKMMRNLMRGQYSKLGDELKQKPESEIYKWIIDQVLKYEAHPGRQVYAGEYPAIAEPIRGMTSMDGYDEFMTWYKATYEVCAE